jgi:hypothetical protein
MIVRACHLVGAASEVKTGLCTDRSEFVLIVGGSQVEKTYLGGTDR